MLKLMHLHDEGKNYLIRVCTAVAEEDNPVPSSVVKQCEECGTDIWYSTRQVPPQPLGVHVDGEVVLCTPCAILHMDMDDEPPKFIPPSPADVEEIRRHLGLD